jgi:hypothetical protein
LEGSGNPDFHRESGDLVAPCPRNSKNIEPYSELNSEVNNYYTWTEYLKESTPYQYIMPQNVFNEWVMQNELIPFKYNLRQTDPEKSKQLEIRLQHLIKTKELQRSVYQNG